MDRCQSFAQGQRFTAMPRLPCRVTPPGLGRRAVGFSLRHGPTVRESFGFRMNSAATKETPPLEPSTPSAEEMVEETMSFLKEDLLHLFDDQGIDASRYDDVVEFRDPLSSYNSIRGYLFNIGFLRRVFSPKFQLHDMRKTGEYEITTRWTMTMEMAFTKGTPLRQWWDPTLVFTGVSIYQLNPKNGKINKHIDLWDSVDQQQFFSFEAFVNVMRQALNVTRAPELETPDFKTLKKTSAYEVREYPPFLVAETDMDSVRASKEQATVNPASAGNRAFNTLAGYIFGKNTEDEKMAMTTPVLTTDAGRMQFVIGKKYKETGMPAPTDTGVVTKETGAGMYAVSSFNGGATEAEVQRVYENLKSVMYRDGLIPGDGWILARYNDPFTAPVLRRNEVLIPIADGFSLW